MALGITTTVLWVTVDRGTGVQLALQATEEKGHFGFHGAFVRYDNLEFNVFVFTKTSLAHDSSALDKHNFVRVISGDETVVSLHVEPL